MARTRKPSSINALLAVYKPTGMTSHDLVARVRRALGERRVGHAGTLDPAAEGVMLVGVGQATRLLGMLTLDTKTYVAGVRFGAETNTDDAEGEVSAVAPVPASVLDRAYGEKLVASFIGESEQVPPAFSAISVNGVRSYKRARAGEEVELPARPIEVIEAKLLSLDAGGEGAAPEVGMSAEGLAGPVWTVAFTVSKGTYIRALARDLGRAAGSAAHVCSLMRTASGDVGLGRCLPLEGLDVETAHMSALDPASLLGAVPAEVCDAQLGDISCGRPLPATGVLGASAASVGPKGLVALVHAGGLVALARRHGSMLKMESVFPQAIEGVRL